MARIIGTQNVTNMLTAKSIMDDGVVNMQGEDIGDIKDLMMDVEKGNVEYAVLEFGGFLGMGGKYFAVPWNSLTIDEDNQRLIMNVSKERLESAPGFDKDNWPKEHDAYYGSVDQYYGGEPPRARL